jgi:prophage regulatory protein
MRGGRQSSSPQVDGTGRTAQRWASKKIVIGAIFAAFWGWLVAEADRMIVVVRIFIHGSPPGATMDNDTQNSTSQTPSPMSQSRTLRLKDVCKATGLGRSFIYQLQAEQRFPHSIKIGARAVGWLESEVRQWIDNRILVSRPNA